MRLSPSNPNSNPKAQDSHSSPAVPAPSATLAHIRLGTGGVAQVPASDWDALHDHRNPFLAHCFLSLLEESGSVCPTQGWQSAPLLAESAEGDLLAAAPAYFKSHSQGEYVFDHGWAAAWEQSGADYYPKLQLAIPFTPVAGARLLCRNRAREGAESAESAESTESTDTSSALAGALLQAAEAIVVENQLSSAHATFVAPEQVAWFRDAGWLLRCDLQFHFENRGYRDFDDFLASLTSARRKQIRKERRRAQAAVRIECVSGAELTASHWQAMWEFYQDTSNRKWGRAYLTRAAFDLLSEHMADSTLLILAYQGEQAVAGALHFIGGDCLYGRYWGCVRDVPYLHFELCYYQAIDFALQRGLARVEAGAQGLEHKLARGYAPMTTWSAHFIRDRQFRQAVAVFLKQEQAMLQADQHTLATHLPFRHER